MILSRCSPVALRNQCFMEGVSGAVTTEGAAMADLPTLFIVKFEDVAIVNNSHVSIGKKRRKNRNYNIPVTG